MTCIRFETENFRQEHSLLKEIPYSIWRYFFFNQIEEKLLSLVSIDSQQKRLEQLKTLPQYLTHKAFVVLCSIKKDFSLDEIQQICEVLNLSLEVQFKLFAMFGKLELMKAVLSKARDTQLLIEENNFDVFHQACRHGQLQVIEFLYQLLSPVQQQQMLTSDNYRALVLTCEYGYLDIIDFLDKHTSDFLTMFKFKNFQAFRTAIIHNQTAVISYFMQRFPEEQTNILTFNNYAALRLAVKNISLLYSFIDLIPDRQAQILAANNYEIFISAASQLNYDLINYCLTNISSEHKEDMIFARNGKVFEEAIIKENTALIDYLLPMMSDPQKIYAQLFLLAVLNNQLKIFEYLQKQISATIFSNFLTENDNAIIRTVIRHGNFRLLRYFLEILQEKAEYTLIKDNFFLCREILKHDPAEILEDLLSFSKIFTYVTNHGRNLGSQISLFIDKQISVLPKSELDLSDDKTLNLWFNIAKYLIRHHDERIGHFIQNGAFQNICHLGDETNELLKLAISTHFTKAIYLLVAIPQVMELSLTQDFYPEIQAQTLSLDKITQDKESSMKGLTPAEQNCLSSALSIYKPIIIKQGIPSIIEDLKIYLKKSYSEHPSSVNEQLLPLEWLEFQALQLSKDVYDKACKAYYKNPIHTAFRYLSQPNPWIDKRAEYIETNPDTGDSWAKIDDLFEFIAVIYLALKDPNFPSEDGFSIEDRLMNYIHELALIGRAHNWNLSKKNKFGDFEEYDDLGPDRPSCYSGTKRRLFQASLGHPLFKMLTIQDLRQEISSYYREHIKIKLQIPSELDKVIKIWKKIEEINFDQDYYLDIQTLNIDDAQKDQFIIQMRAKYQGQFSIDARYEAEIHRVFSNSEAQLAALAGSIHLDQLINQQLLNNYRLKHQILHEQFLALILNPNQQILKKSKQQFSLISEAFFKDLNANNYAQRLPIYLDNIADWLKSIEPHTQTSKAQKMLHNCLQILKTCFELLFGLLTLGLYPIHQRLKKKNHQKSPWLYFQTQNEHSLRYQKLKKELEQNARTIQFV